MNRSVKCILVINAGSSSIKFSIYDSGPDLREILHGQVDHIGSQQTILSYSRPQKLAQTKPWTEPVNITGTIEMLVEWLQIQEEFSSILAIGHRVVHGMKHTQPQLVTEELLAELKKISAFDPEHLPAELQLINQLKEKHPLIPQFACFDTSFHTTMPVVAKLLPIPGKYFEKGVYRYGFHGISYSFLLEEVERLEGKEASLRKIIMAHLGNGASLCAVNNGKSIDTSMGFTPASGIPMGTRSGDIDPGIASFLMREEKMDAAQFDYLINHQSGLLGISGTSADIRTLLQTELTNKHAAEAIAVFCYQVKKCIGGFAAILGGVDQLIFSGGIGENSPEIRKRICEGLSFLGIVIAEEKNKYNEAVISNDNSKVSIRVIHTNEQLMIAKSIKSLLNFSHKNQ